MLVVLPIATITTMLVTTRVIVISTFTTGAQKIFKPKKIKNERKRELSPKSSSSDLEHFYFSENSINPSSASVALM